MLFQHPASISLYALNLTLISPHKSSSWAVFFHQIITPTQWVLFPYKFFAAWYWHCFGNFASIIKYSGCHSSGILDCTCWRLVTNDLGQPVGPILKGRTASVTNHQPMLCNIPEEQRTQTHCSRSLKDPNIAIIAFISPLSFFFFKIKSNYYMTSPHCLCGCPTLDTSNWHSLDLV
jgi:hypothetical protein